MLPNFFLGFILLAVLLGLAILLKNVYYQVTGKKKPEYESYHLCPKCDSREGYQSYVQKMTGMGLYLRARTVGVVLCRKCDVAMIYRTELIDPGATG